MLQGLKITVYDIERSPLKVLEVSPDHNLYVFLAVILLDHASIPDLVSCPEHLLVSFTLPSLYRALITPHIHSPLLCYKALMFEVPGKPLYCVFLCQKGSLSSTPIGDAMSSQDYLDGSLLNRQLTRQNKLYICILWV
jgi:hypothetical protein